MLAMAMPISLVREALKSPRSDDGGEAADEHRGGEVAAVLVVWERKPDPIAVATGRPALSYNAADEQILRTLAALAGHLLLQDEETALTLTLTPTLPLTPTPTLPLTLLLQDEETTRLQRAHDEATQRDRARKTQMQATPHPL